MWMPASACLLVVGLSTYAMGQAPQAGQPAERGSGTQGTAQQGNEGQNASQGQQPAARKSSNVREGTVRTQREANFRAEGGHSRGLDSHIADCLILGNQEEITLLQFGIHRTENDEVKQLAQKMMQDHQKAIQDLAQFAANAQGSQDLPQGDRNQDAASPTRAENRAKDGTADRSEASKADRQPAASAQSPAGGRNDANTEARREGATQSGPASKDLSAQLFAVARDEEQRCAALTQEQLGKHQGQEFDKAFLGQQLGMHVGMLAKLQASKDAVSSELREVLQKAEKTTQEHMQHVEQLKEQIGGREGREAQPGQNRSPNRAGAPARRPNTAPGRPATPERDGANRTDDTPGGQTGSERQRPGGQTKP